MELRAFARQLRREATDAERLMWYLLRDRRLAGRKFRRQHPVPPYVLDFYCAELKLAIELDGGQHAERFERDAQREAYLAEHGIRVLRFWNHEVLSQTEAVLEAIWREVAPSPLVPLPGGEESGPHPQPLSQGERGVALTPNPSPGGRGEWPSPPTPLPAGEGGAWRGHSDTETLLAYFEAWGVEETLKRAVGMFALALWDRETRTLTLARDRMGEKPLYYGWVRGALVFGSELKALRAFPGFDNGIERRALALFMRHNYVPAPWSIYENIWKLPPGCYVQFDLRPPPPNPSPAGRGGLPSPPTPLPGGEGSGPHPQPLSPGERGVALTPNPSPGGRGEVKAYWRVANAVEAGLREPFVGTDAEAAEALERLLKQSITGQMLADVPLGAFLSGGIDSTTIVALMQAQSSRPVKTFTIGFHEGDYNEAEHAKAVARHLGTEHTELYVTPDEAMAVIPHLPALYDEPFADSSQIPTFLVAQLARQHVTVSLSGDGGDELFGGYNRYFWTRALWKRLGRMPMPLRRALAAVTTAPSPQAWNRLFGLLQPVLPRRLRVKLAGDKMHKLAELVALDSLEAVYRYLVSHWKHPAEELVLGATEPETILSRRDEWPARLARGDQPFEDVMMFLDQLTYLPDDILVKVDRAAMGVSLETRVPLLDHRVVEFAWQLPLSMKIRDGQSKWLLRQVLYKHVPRELMERPKMGFGVPLDQWLRGPLREWAEDLLSEARLKREGFLNPEPVRRQWAEHLSGRRNWAYYLWDVLMWEAWWDFVKK
ncbi:asparagine synthase-related protein [Sulfuricystis multivorans]|uniref:asparagine synthase-related protein n=1 Tax=Sulfuricystis multivorans TaxID=2211108 RepID=UPI0024DF911F|nr:asparagine synthase-related protein [Sulfuricystis multivorans]